MRRGSIVYSALLIAFCACLLTGTAAAAPKEPVREFALPVGFELEGTNGYLISAGAYPGEMQGRGAFALTVRRGSETVSYLAPAKVTPTSIHADLGKLGRVDLVLRRSGQVETSHVPCVNFTEDYEAGTWEGLIEFDGEAGFTRARATEAVGLPWIAVSAEGSACDNQSKGEAFSSQEPGARLKGVSYAGGRTIKFQINKNRPGGRTIFTASLAERERGIRIYRELSGVAPAGAFRYDKRVRTATLGPPAPFSGSAHLRRSPNAVSPLWAGSLTLAFPGRSVPLAGPSFHVSLQHARQTHGDDSGSVGISF